VDALADRIPSHLFTQWAAFYVYEAERREEERIKAQVAARAGQ